MRSETPIGLTVLHGFKGILFKEPQKNIRLIFFISFREKKGNLFYTILVSIISKYLKLVLLDLILYSFILEEYCYSWSINLVNEIALIAFKAHITYDSQGILAINCPQEPP